MRHSKFLSIMLVVAVGIVATFAVSVGAVENGAIRNPYYSEPTWKLWSNDESPVTVNGKTIQTPNDDQRMTPLEPESGSLLRFQRNSKAKTPYSGFWDDVYCNQDKGHSDVIGVWKDEHGSEVSLRGGYISHQGVGTFFHRHGQRVDVGGDDLAKLGANFTSQSTTGMGHDITNDAIAAVVVERVYYFANVLKTGPAHLSFYDIEPEFSDDKYEALNPTFYNSVGSSGSESWALGKMMIAGAYLKKEVKQSAKRHGVYPATLLYIWKAGLPYDVPFGCELRHRVAYFSKGDHSDYLGPNQVEFNQWYHRYDETEHMRRMIVIAKSLSCVPPIAILKDVQVTGARQIYAHKASALFHQVLDADLRISFAATDCYDVDGKPVTTRVEVVSGHPETKVEQTSEKTFLVTIPGDASLPQGRTCLALIANNGETDGNPAIITIYRHDAKRNRRPELAVPAETNILPGQRVSFPVETRDPEGFDVAIYRPLGEVGSVSEGQFDWQSKQDQPLGEYPVTLIASDRTSGSSTSSKQSLIHVRSTVAEMVADVTTGKAPLTVAFSGARSRDSSGQQLQCNWDFDDGRVTIEENATHRFEEPGFYQVSLDVDGTSQHRETKIIHAKHDWPLRLNRERPKNLFAKTWWKQGQIGVSDKRSHLELVKSNEEVRDHGLVLTGPIRTPCYLEFESRRKRGSPGAGLEVLGYLFGCPRETNGSKPFGPDMSLVLPDGPQRLITQPVWGRSSTTIRMYVSNDPLSAGRLRFRGFVDWKQGSTFFRADGLAALSGTIRILLGEHPGMTTIRRFKIWYQ